ncbi:hypothetical protein ACTWP4_19150 [Gracilibacillus sp. D59]|uniref:hypothetical protein n=1 Tax=Gracilibacillus sp. D59 TaxID=3457434 RepID=UPI003FCC5E71
MVLWTDNETLLKRDNMRKPEHRMGERCLILANEFMESGLDEKYFYETGKNMSYDITNVLNEIMNNQKYKI